MQTYTKHYIAGGWSDALGKGSGKEKGGAKSVFEMDEEKRRQKRKEKHQLAKGGADGMGKLIAQLYTQLADFPRIVNTVHRNGYDVFVELGAADFRQAAIRDILSERGGPNVAVALDRKGQGAWRQLLRMCATLISHGGTGCRVGGLYHPSLLQAAEVAAAQLPPKASAIFSAIVR